MSTDAGPDGLDRVHADLTNGRLTNEMITETQRERFRAGDRLFARERVHGVPHRVGRDARAVVAIVDRFERSLEPHVERQLRYDVRRSGAIHFHQPHGGLAVAVPGDAAHAPRYVE